MNRTRVLLTLACATYLVAWFLPVVEDGTTLGKGGLPGWEALRFALAPIWEGGAGLVWWQAVISVLSAFTNGWLVLSVAALLHRGLLSGHLITWGLVVSALVDAQWFLLTEGGEDLRVGYYLWTLSFVLLAAAAWRWNDPASREADCKIGPAHPSLGV